MYLVYFGYIFSVVSGLGAYAIIVILGLVVFSYALYVIVWLSILITRRLSKPKAYKILVNVFFFINLACLILMSIFYIYLLVAGAEFYGTVYVVI